MKEALIHYGVQVCTAGNQFVSAVLFGWAGETISARAWRLEQSGHLAGKIARPAIDFAFRYLPEGVLLGGADHCERASRIVKERRNVPPELR